MYIEVRNPAFPASTKLMKYWLSENPIKSANPDNIPPFMRYLVFSFLYIAGEFLWIMKLINKRVKTPIKNLKVLRQNGSITALALFCAGKESPNNSDAPINANIPFNLLFLMPTYWHVLKKNQTLNFVKLLLKNKKF